MEVFRSCANQGSVQAAVYASEETAILFTDNYISGDFGSAVCGSDEGRLVQESAGSGCFEANRTDCAFDCEAFFDAPVCRANETDAPSTVPSSSPTTGTLKPSQAISTHPSVSRNPTIQPTAMPVTLTNSPATAMPIPLKITDVPTIGVESLSPSLPPAGVLTDAPFDTGIPTRAPIMGSSPTENPRTNLPIQVPITWAPTKSPSLIHTRSPTTRIPTKNPTHVPLMPSPAVVFDPSEMPALLPTNVRPPNGQPTAPNMPNTLPTHNPPTVLPTHNPPNVLPTHNPPNISPIHKPPNIAPTHNPLTDRSSPTFLPVPTQAPAVYDGSNDDSDDEHSDDECDCGSGKKKGKSRPSFKGSGKGKKSKGKRHKSKKCKCHKSEKRHVQNYQANHVLHNTEERA
jgi:hypothetical protein